MRLEHYGKIILLNGTSSSGKTSIAKELERILDGYSYVSIDYFGREFKRLHQAELVKKRPQGALDYVVSKFHDDIARRALARENIVVDHVLQEQVWVDDCARKLADYEVILVGIKCPIDVLEQREIARGDRIIGIAKYQFGCVHNNKLYDLEINTAEASPTHCAEVIRLYLQQESPSSNLTTSQKMLGQKD